LEVAADRRLGGDDAVGGEHLHQLGLAGDRLLLEQPRDAVLALGLAERRHQAGPNRWVRTARAACMRLAACCHTAERGPSITDAATSSPRCAGRQCRNHASGCAQRSISSSTVNPANAARRAAVSSSCPIDVHTSVYTASAPATASYGSWPSSMLPPRLRARSTVRSSSS